MAKTKKNKDKELLNSKIINNKENLDTNEEDLFVVIEEEIIQNKPKFYNNIEQLMGDMDFLPTWRNGETPLNELNMNKLNSEIRQKYDGIELDKDKRLILKTDGLNRHIIDLKQISENNYSNEEKEKVSKIDDIESKLDSLSLDFGTF